MQSPAPGWSGSQEHHRASRPPHRRGRRRTECAELEQRTRSESRSRSPGKHPTSRRRRRSPSPSFRHARHGRAGPTPPPVKSYGHPQGPQPHQKTPVSTSVRDSVRQRPPCDHVTPSYSPPTGGPCSFPHTPRANGPSLPDTSLPTTFRLPRSSSHRFAAPPADPSGSQPSAAASNYGVTAHLATRPTITSSAVARMHLKEPPRMAEKALKFESHQFGERMKRSVRALLFLFPCPFAHSDS